MMKRLTNWIMTHQKRMYIIIGIVLLTVFGTPIVLHLIQYRARYNWNYEETFGDKESKAPFGAKYLEEHLRATWKNVEVDTTFSQALKKHRAQACNYLVLSNPRREYFNARNYVNDDPTEDDQEYEDYYEPCYEWESDLVRAVTRGNNIIVVNSDLYWNNAFLIHSTYNGNFSLDNVRSQGVQFDSLKYSVPNSGREDEKYAVRSQLLTYSFWFSLDDDYISKQELELCYGNISSVGSSVDLLVDEVGNSYALERQVGGGKMLFVGIPALFSNYAMGDPELQKLTEHLMHETFDDSRPLVIIYPEKNHKDYDYTDTKSDDQLFYVLLEHKETALALYILLAMLLMWMIFNSRRRRRSEVNLPKEKNTNIDYVKHIATLYTAHSDYLDLLQLEERKLLYQLRKDFRFATEARSYTKASEFARLIAKAKGLKEEEVREALLALEELTTSNQHVSRKNYLNCIKMLEDIIRNK